MRIKIESSGSFNRTSNFLQKISNGDSLRLLNKCGREGVAALASATPLETGDTRSSWSYKVSKTRVGASITWFNNNTEGGAPIAIMLQYGHGTGTGGYVQGRDYINPAMKPIFDKIADDVWKAVTSA